MICVICKHGQTRPGPATVTLEREGTTLVIKGVPAQVCANAGKNMWMRTPPRVSFAQLRRLPEPECK